MTGHTHPASSHAVLHRQSSSVQPPLRNLRRLGMPQRMYALCVRKGTYVITHQDMAHREQLRFEQGCRAIRMYARTALALPLVQY